MRKRVLNLLHIGAVAVGFFSIFLLVFLFTLCVHLLESSTVGFTSNLKGVLRREFMRNPIIAPVVI